MKIMIISIASLLLAASLDAAAVNSYISNRDAEVMGPTMNAPERNPSPNGWICGSVPTPEEEALMQRLLEDGTWDKFKQRDLSSDRGTKYVNVTFHLIGYSNGSDALDESYPQILIDQLNEVMDGTGLQFCIKGDLLFYYDDDLAVVNYFDPSTYPTIGFLPDTMNVYCVPELIGAGGFASYPNGTLFVMANYAAVPGSGVFGHEAGHFFSLRHTFDTAAGVECVDGSNCGSAGDLICDTPADDNGGFGFNCQYVGNGTDPCNGDPYSPLEDNLMSYNSYLCLQEFTPQQKSIIVSVAETFRAQLLTDEPCDPALPTGACCIGNGCSVQNSPDCIEAGGQFLGDGTDCDDDPCGGGPNTLIVDSGGTGNFTDIQSALDFASDGDEIVVYPGTYRGSGLDVADTKGKAVWLHSSEGPEVTFIAGQSARRGVLCDSGETADTIIEGFTIRNCAAPLYDLFGNGNANEFQLGGGILVKDSSPTIIDCIIENNTAPGNGFGGGIFTGAIDGQCQPNFINCLISNNSGKNGGGVYAYYGSLDMQSSRVSENMASGTLGGGFFIDNASVTLGDMEVCANTPDQIAGDWNDAGGNYVSGICLSTGACCIGNDCTVETSDDCDANGGKYVGDATPCEGNTCFTGPTTWTVSANGPADFNDIQSAVDAAYDGDEIIVYPGVYTSTHPGHVVDLMGKAIWLHSIDGPETTIIDGESSRRGVVCFNGEDQGTLIQGFTITQCLGIEYDYDGSGGYSWWEVCGGGVYFRGASPSLSDCIITSNVSGYGGGGIYFESSDPVISNCIITNNQAQFGGGLTGFSNPSYSIESCDISGNFGLNGGGMFVQSCGVGTMTNCLVIANSGMSGIVNQISEPPTLIDTTVCENEMYQIQGDWTDGGGNSVDDVCPSCIGDATGDGVIDVDDALYVISSWDTPDPNADFDEDGLVDTDDILILLSQFGVVCE